jgi:oligosaccharyltransferase complex subunit epsilon
MVAEKDLSIFQILGKLQTNYLQNTPKRIKLIDLFIVYLGMTSLILFGYVAAVGTFPFNAFLAAFFTSLCLLVLTGKI